MYHLLKTTLLGAALGAMFGGTVLAGHLYLEDNPPSITLSGMFNAEMANKFQFFMGRHQGEPRINIKIDSPGGSVVALNTILDTMDKEHAKGTKFYCSTNSAAVSAGAAVLFHCDNIEASPRAYIMIHMGGIMSSPQQVELTPFDPIEDKIWIDFALSGLNEASRWLKPEEIQKVKDGGDVELTGKELMARIHAK